MNNTKAHQQLVDDLMYTIGGRPGFRIFPRRVGLAIPKGSLEPIYFGIKGEADLQGFFKVHGHACIEFPHGDGPMKRNWFNVSFAFEVKTGKGVLTKDQENWKKMFESCGGIYIEARDLQDALREFDFKIGYKA